MSVVFPDLTVELGVFMAAARGVSALEDGGDSQRVASGEGRYPNNGEERS